VNVAISLRFSARIYYSVIYYSVIHDRVMRINKHGSSVRQQEKI
jgi:hypothetical protein